jgi:phospholipid/cholesterol/gamma-HCH transport system permease protein
MLNWLGRINSDVGAGLIFLKELVITFKKRPCSTAQVADQVLRVTWQSLPTTAMAGFFVGGIMAIQFALQVQVYDALGYLGGLATSATIREIGPLLIAFMLSGKVGAFTSAELGTMRVTEQIDAIRCLGADPLQEVVLPRFLGIIISSFFLLLAGLMMSIFGGALIGGVFADINFEEYMRHIPQMVSGWSLFIGLLKCLTFALLLATICTYKGYTASGGAKGVGRAVVETAVATMVGIVVMDWFTSFLSDVALSLWQGHT